MVMVTGATRAMVMEVEIAVAGTAGTEAAVREGRVGGRVAATAVAGREARLVGAKAESSAGAGRAA